MQTPQTRIVLFASGGGYLEHLGKMEAELAELLARMQGAEVALIAPLQITGRYAGCQCLREELAAEEKPTMVSRPVVNLVTSQAARSVPISTVQSISFTDAELEGRLETALEALLAEHNRQGWPLELVFLDRYNKPTHLPVEDSDRKCGTLVPLTKPPIRLEKISVYDCRREQPAVERGLIMSNRGTRKLLGCPINIFDGGQRVGQAKMDDLAPGARCIVPYRPDPHLTVESTPRSESKVISARIAAGRLHVKTALATGHKLVIANASPENLPLIVEYPRVADGRLVEPVEYEQKTPDLWRVRFHVYKDSKRMVAVMQERVVEETFDIAEAKADRLEEYACLPGLSEQFRRALQKAIQLRSQGKQQQLQGYLKDLQVE